MILRFLLLIALAPLFSPISFAGTKVYREPFFYLIDVDYPDFLRIHEKTGAEDRLTIGKGAIDCANVFDLLLILNIHTETVLVVDTQTFKIIFFYKTQKGPKCLGMNEEAFAYIPNSQSNSLTFLNVLSKKHQHIVHKSFHTPTDICFNIYYGYVLNYNGASVTEIYLHNHKVLRTFDVGHYPLSIVYFNHALFVISGYDHTLGWIDLNKQESQFLKIGVGSEEMKISNRIGAILNKTSHSLSLIELGHPTTPATIPLEDYPDAFAFCFPYIFVAHSDINILTIIELNQSNGEYITQTKARISCPEKFLLEDKFLYVIGSTAISALHIPTLRVVGTVAGTFKTHKSFVRIRNALYLENAPILNIKNLGDPWYHAEFFDKYFDGIYGECSGNGEAEFKKALSCVSNRAFESARKHFQLALCYGDAKANALGALAFFYGLWGAQKDEAWFFEFFKVCDLETYAHFRERIILDKKLRKF